MSCDTKCCPRTSLLGLLALLFLAAFLMANSKEILRYIKISNM